MAVRVERDGSVVTIIHSRPEARNAMDPASADALVAAFLTFDADPSAHVAVLWGEGGAFCAGWDLRLASLLGGPRPLSELDFPRDGGPPPLTLHEACRVTEIALKAQQAAETGRAVSLRDSPYRAP